MPIKYNLLSDLVMRTPLYSFMDYDLESVGEVLKTKAFCNALYLASPEFYDLLKKKDFSFERLNEKQKHTLEKYYNRMSFRATPFGSFASFSLLSWNDEGIIRLSPEEQSLLHLLPDQQLLINSYRSERMRDDLLLSLNPTIYLLGTEYRWIKSIPGNQTKLNYSIEAIAVNEVIEDLIGLLKQKKVTLSILVSWLCRSTGCTESEASEYSAFLVEGQMIYTYRQGHVTGNVGHIFEKHFSLMETGLLPDLISDLQSQIPVLKNIKSKHFFYSSLERKVESGGLPEQTAEELLEAISILSKFSWEMESSALKKFIRDFEQRFDQEKVPFLTALDPDYGIPYNEFLQVAEGLLKDIQFPAPVAEASKMEWTEKHKLLFRLWVSAKEKDQYSPIELHPQDLAGLAATKDVALPSSMTVMFHQTEEHLVLDYTGGVTATSLIGRFSLFSKEIQRLCAKIAKNEERSNPDVIFADISQVSDSHSDNINRRKEIYSYEIPVNVYSSVPVERQILPDDLVLFVRNGLLFMESLKLEKRVIPRLTSAFNYQHNDLGYFRLLCDLQHQGLNSNLTFSLQHFFPELPFYPRVYYRRTILTLARWYFKPRQISLLLQQQATEPLFFVRHLRKLYGIPQYISLGNSDQQLIFDLAQKSEARFFVNCLDNLKDKDQDIQIQEYLLPEKFVKSDKKAMSAQFMAFLEHQEAEYSPASSEQEMENQVQREFLLGSNWLYLKIFCTPQTSDRLLTEVIWPFVNENRLNIFGWFFIRYGDGGHHLRVRINLPTSNLGDILVAINKKIHDKNLNGTVKNFQADTYRRELERYGASFMPLVEKVFEAGSVLVCQSIKSNIDEQLQVTEFQLGCICAYQMINCFIDQLEACVEFTIEITGSLYLEFNGGKQLKRDLDDKYRHFKVYIERWLAPDGQAPALNNQLQTFLEATKDIGHMSREKASSNHSLLADLIHMQLNRTFSFAQRQQELVVYSCLQKHFSSLKARKKAIK